MNLQSGPIVELLVAENWSKTALKYLQQLMDVM